MRRHVRPRRRERISHPPDSALPCDVLVLGGGVAALCAAIAAREAGAMVRLLERAPRSLRGGNTRHSRNFRVAHTAPTPFSLGRYPEDEYLAELRTAAHGRCDEALARHMVRASAAIPGWLAGRGVQLQPVSGGILPPSRRTVFCLGGGMAMMNALYATAQRLGIEVHYATTAAAMRIEHARVREVAVADATGREMGRQMVRPRAVIACCGGYQANQDRLRPHWGDAAERLIVRGIPHAQGEILFDLLAQGAATVGAPGACHLVAVDARSPQTDGGIVTRVRGIPAGIVVDASARRFHDEAADLGPTRYAAWGNLVARRDRQAAFLVLDATAERDVRPSIFPPIRAATLAGLAAAIGLDAAALAATVAGFNAAIHTPDGQHAAAAGTTGLAPPKTRWARPITTPPFSAIPIRPGITFTCHGVRVDGRARVLLQDGRPVENLFAAGMIMAPNVLDTGYLAGAAITIGAVFGRIAGEEAARYARG